MQTKYKVLLAAIALLVSFVFGRYSNSFSSKETKQTTSEDAGHKKTTTVVEEKPDGSKKTSTTTVEDTKKKTSNKDSTQTSAPANGLAGRRFHVAALAGVPFSFAPRPSIGAFIYGGEASVSIIGPISIGVWALSLPAAGVSVGLEF